MKEKIIEILEKVYQHGVQTGIYLHSNLSDEYVPLTFNSFIERENIINQLTQSSEKPTYEAKNRIQQRISDTIKQYIKDEDLIAEIEIDLTWLSEFDSIHADSEEPSTTTIEKTEGEITITSTGNLGSDPNPNATLKVEKPSAEEWSIEEAERKFEYLLDQYETYVKYETTPIFLKDSVMEAFMNFWEQYAKQ
jgi:hypothetical protein